MSYFDQYSPIAAQAADNAGIDRSVFFGLIQTESSWNPNATPGTSSAFGFTQLLRGTAAQLGVNRFDPTQNLYGGAQYLASMPGSTIREKLAHYYDGPAKIASDGLAYADKVLKNAGKYMGVAGSIVALSNPATAAASGLLGTAASTLGIGGNTSSSWFDELKNWITSSGFFQRIALALVALILILGAVYTLKGKQV